MTIKTLTAYSLYCDKCGERFASDVFDIWAEQGDMLDVAMESEWQERDGKHYCWGCAEVDDDDRPDAG